MSNFNNLDNEGSGFSLDDDDLESLLGQATSASEDDDGVSPGTAMPEFSFDDEVPVRETNEFLEPEPEAPRPTLDEFEPEAPIVPAVADESWKQEQEMAAESPAPAPEVVEPAPAYIPPTAIEEVAPPPPPVATPVAAASPMKGRVYVPTEEDQRVDTARIIQIIDTYRKLSDKERGIATQFVTNGEMSQADDATLVVKVLNADPTLGPTMKALCDAYEADAVERAFYTMSLTTEMLHSLGSLVSVFTQEAYDTSQTNLAYSRQIVAGIAGLGDVEISYVRATESVLAATEIKPIG